MKRMHELLTMHWLLLQDEVVDKEVAKVAEEVNKELVKEVNDGLVLICRCGDDCWGDHSWRWS